MSRIAGLLCLAVLATACSDREGGSAPSGSGAPVAPPSASQATSGQATSGLDGEAARPAGQGGGMVGEVSGLTGARSGLNVRVTAFGTVVDLNADALFDYDKATLTPAAEAELRKAADLIRRSPPGALKIIGHTDSHGEAAYNLSLSEARARTVAAWFGQQVGIRQRTFEVSGKGEAEPVAPNATATGADDPLGRAKNRRVEVVLPK